MASQTPEKNITDSIPLGSIDIMPDDWGTPHTQEWWKRKAVWVTSNYNHWIPRFAGTRWDTSRNPTTDRWATNIGKWISYYKATQDNITLGHFARDVHNKPLDIPIINGQTIYQICKHHEGKLYKNYVEMLDERVGVADRTPDVLDERMKVLELTKLGIDLEFAKNYEQIGVQFQPIAGKKFDTYEQATKYMEESPMEQVERIFTACAKDFLWANDWREQFQEIIRYLVTVYYCRVWVYAQNGRIKLKVYRPDMCIWDNWANQGSETYSKKDRFQGVLELLTIPELFSRYNFTDAEKEELNSIAKHNTGMPIPEWYASTNTYIGNSDRMWWNINTRIPTVVVAQTYWRGLKEDGKTQTLYRCDLIGNRYIKNNGEAKNIVEDKDDPSYVENEFIDCRPEMFYGSNQGLIERLSNLSDEVDALEQKNRLFIARALGKVLFVNRSQLDENTHVREILTDAKTMGIVTYEGVDIEDAQAKYPGQDIIDVAELTVDGQGIIANRAEINEKKRQMELIASTPEAVMGQQVLQGSNQELQSTISNASYGNVPLYDSFYLFINQIIQRAVDRSKIVLSQSEKEKVLQISERDFTFVKFLKDYTLKDMRAYADQRDGISPEEQMKYFDIIFNYSQNPDSGITPEDAFTILSLHSKREVINYVAGQTRIYNLRKEMIRQQELAAQQEQAAMANQTQENIAATQADAGLAKEEMKTHRDLMLQQGDMSQMG